MIALYSLVIDAELEQIRSNLLTHGIPCICLGPHSSRNSVMAHVPFVYIHSAGEAVSDGVADKIPPCRIIASVDLLSVNSILKCLYKTYRIDYADMPYGSIRFSGNDFYYRGNYIRLTPGEKLIMRLLTVCHSMYFTSQQIAGFCTENTDTAAVPVHISHINKKVSSVCGEKIIISKRHYGYKIP